MAELSTITKRFMDAANVTAARNSLKIASECLDDLKALARTGTQKLDVMEMAEDESRVDTAETNFCLLIKSMVKEARDRGQFEIDSTVMAHVLSRQGSVWPFS